MSHQITLEVFTDYICPWCYLCTGRIEKLKQEYDIKVNLVLFPLHPETPVEGRSLHDLFAGRGYDLDKMFEQMKGLMDAEGLPYSVRTHTYNSRLAQELGKWGDTQPQGEALHAALYRAYFVDGKNLADVPALLEVVASLGMDEAAAQEVLESRGFSDAVDADWDRARELGLTGVPTFVAGGYGLVGAQSYEMLGELMQEAGAARKQPA